MTDWYRIKSPDEQEFYKDRKIESLVLPPMAECWYIDGTDVIGAQVDNEWWIIPGSSDDDETFQAVGPFDSLDLLLLQLRFRV